MSPFLLRPEKSVAAAGKVTKRLKARSSLDQLATFWSSSISWRMLENHLREWIGRLLRECVTRWAFWEWKPAFPSLVSHVSLFFFPFLYWVDKIIEAENTDITPFLLLRSSVKGKKNDIFGAFDDAKRAQRLKRNDPEVSTLSRSDSIDPVLQSLLLRLHHAL